MTSISKPNKSIIQCKESDYNRAKQNESRSSKKEKVSDDIALQLSLKSTSNAVLPLINEDDESLSFQYNKLKMQHRKKFQSEMIDKSNLYSESSSQEEINSPSFNWNCSSSEASEEFSKNEESVVTNLEIGTNSKLQFHPVGTDDTTLSQTPIATKIINDKQAAASNYKSTLQLGLEKLEFEEKRYSSTIEPVAPDEESSQSKCSSLHEMESVSSSTTGGLNKRRMLRDEKVKKMLKSRKRLKSIGRLFSNRVKSHANSARPDEGLTKSQ